jgi:chemotaxis protein MotB
MIKLMVVSKFNFSLILFSISLLSTPLHADEICAPIELKAARGMNSLLKETIEGLEEQITLEKTMKTNPTCSEKEMLLEEWVLAEQKRSQNLRENINNTNLEVLALKERLDRAASEFDKTELALATALARQINLETSIDQLEDEAKEKELLRAQAMALLKDKENQLKKSVQQTLRVEKQTTVLNAQLAQLRNQMGQLQALLAVSEQKDIDSKVMLQNMGNRLNAALARAVAEERKTRKLEEAERKRLEVEQARLEKEQRRLEEEKKILSKVTENLEKHKSEFFGRLREVLSDRKDVRIVGDRFVLSSKVLFASGRARLSRDGQKEITKVGRILTEIMRELPKNIDWIIRVDGHTDSTPIKNSEFFDDNWDLSQARALSVVRFLISELDIPPQRLAANGFGEFQPINPRNTLDAKEQNRRIELKLTER